MPSKIMSPVKKNNLNLWDFTHFLDKINFVRIINAILLKKLSDKNIKL